MAKILDGICSNTPILEGIDDWPRSASKTECFRITRELIQSVIADMDLDPDSLSQVEEGLTIFQYIVYKTEIDRPPPLLAKVRKMHFTP